MQGQRNIKKKVIIIETSPPKKVGDTTMKVKKSVICLLFIKVKF
jgi:hypothetical protein